MGTARRGTHRGRSTPYPPPDRPLPPQAARSRPRQKPYRRKGSAPRPPSRHLAQHRGELIPPIPRPPPPRGPPSPPPPAAPPAARGPARPQAETDCHGTFDPMGAHERQRQSKQELGVTSGSILHGGKVGPMDGNARRHSAPDHRENSQRTTPVASTILIESSRSSHASDKN